ncbi:MAG: protein TolR [Nitrospirae bacterium CG18_big_fil_WC_8_21_14_2_50_70_55]|nr:protein TolR [Deltaproteobacteria bacterium]OIP64445.1 MAG: protein TolR [Nitrospirae bacterium CG2_30_70_394]PIQ05581.1 MAG: protein TolR [Nitrospirae bacterium CG18_big_fil_WC_8_21_14_2_50_70_55]PIU77445.1 MAG: protein TolR [Nitrospirae bacterium CG06_land_8_20_14_3_00_70_43]PIW83939.1 MAG: protein TolR [Nitrospirae bacterium CG_4_8_14_3_um_filter_70_85]PIX82259.1 MAG: protein TolR [Nitrospirae bacterium CG_4_10_14_3_um_filter_70_108]PJB96942.1 MAG: protein TolR [Nitrospirae bacterium CG
MLRRRAGRAPIANINVTPLVDVMLVLLIIFMVTSPMLTQGVDVDLPETTSTPVKQAKEPLTVTINRDGQVALEDHVVEVGGLGAKVVAIFAAREDERREVLLRADRTVPYGVVAQVMASLQEAGVDHLGMMTRPLETR